MSERLLFNFARLAIILALNFVSLLRATRKRLSKTPTESLTCAEPQRVKLQRNKLRPNAPDDLVCERVVEEESARAKTAALGTSS